MQGTAYVPFRCVAIITRVNETKPPPDYVIPSERSESRNLPEWQILPCVGTFLTRGGFLHSACAMVGMTSSGTFLVFVETSSVLSGAERHIGRSLRFHPAALFLGKL